MTDAVDTAATAAIDASPLVALDDVTMRFRTRKGLFRGEEVTAVAHLSFGVGVGETLSLVGESGSGKTTAGRISLRLLEPSAGRVAFAGREITHLPENQLGWLRRRTAMVFQDPFSSLNPYMSVGDLIAEPLLIDGVRSADERRRRVRDAMAAVDLTPIARFVAKYPTAMSGGQRQRVGIARALIRNPDYIVADEPVSMVDASSRVEILDLLRRLQRERGVAFLYITHDIASARHFAHRIAVMYRGAIVETGSPPPDYRQPGAPLYTSLDRGGARAGSGEPVSPARHGPMARRPRGHERARDRGRAGVHGNRWRAGPPGHRSAGRRVRRLKVGPSARSLRYDDGAARHERDEEPPA